MQRYGKIIDGELSTRIHMLQGYKPLVYGEMPEDFYEESHYLIEKEPEEFDSYIFIGYEAVDLEIEVDEDSEMTIEEIKAGIEERKKEYFNRKEKLSAEERLEQTENLLQATTMAFTEYVFNQMMGK